jgi:sodium-dependent dicarboxylate transporter 2/3/5
MDRHLIREELDSLGSMRYEEKVVLTVFVSTALLWTFRRDLHLGATTIPGWANLWAPFKALDDGTIAIAMALLLFFIPSKNQENSRRILEGEAFGRLPWGIILLFGGGFALATGFTASGFSQYLGDSFTALGNLPVFAIIAIICLGVTFLTELTSNVATASILLPLLAAWAVSREVHPLLFMVPATISASMAFMMPVATPPNAVIFGSQRIRIAEMARIGIVLNFAAMAITLATVSLLFGVVFGSSPSEFPDWAK